MPSSRQTSVAAPASSPAATAVRSACSIGFVTFVMPTGYTFNLDGTTLYLALATLFIAQVYGIQLSLMQQLAIMVRTDNGSWEIRKTAAFALGVLGWDADNNPEPRAVGALAAAVRHRSWQVRVEALHSLIHLGPTKEAQDTRPAIDTLTGRE